MLVPRYDASEIPEMTQKVAEAAFPKGNKAMEIRKTLGVIFTDEDFQAMYPSIGQPAESPSKLAMVTVLQYMEQLTDREAAEAVRSRIDWKYLLGLELTDAGFDYSILSEFRQRLIKREKEALLLEKVITKCTEKGFLKGKAKQRTDSTHVLAKIRLMNRMEVVGETMRRALNELAQEAPTWLEPLILPEWGKRYGRKIETRSLSKTKQQEWIQTIGEDGYYLLDAIYDLATPVTIKELKSVIILRQVWVQQFYRDDNKTIWRDKSHGRPPASKMIASPDDLEARYAKKGTTKWTGYKVHLTETCAENSPHLITHVETTIAPMPDLMVTEKIEEALIDKQLSPDTHWCDGAYIDVETIVNSQQRGIDLVGPVHQDSSWQAREQSGYDLSYFEIDWTNMTATCPEGKVSSYSKKHTNAYDKLDFHFKFHFQTCHSCSVREKCTRSKKSGRTVTVYPQQWHDVLTKARQRQATDAFVNLYNKRAGVEGTISQAIRKFGVRDARYRGLKKTRLQHLATAAAINLHRLGAWLFGDQPKTTRITSFASLASIF